MIDSVLQKKNCALKTKITIKSLISVTLIVLAVVVPQLVHLAFGAQGGIMLLPMYFPVLLAGCLLGPVWGLGVGVMSPVVSYLITLSFGNPMPALARLPFMIAELAVFAVVSGLFAKKISQNIWIAFPATLIAAVGGRAFFILLAAIFQSVSSLSVALVWQQIQTGLVGLVLQALIVPFIVMGLSLLLNKEKNQKL